MTCNKENPRFKIIDWSVSYHCCFDYTVVDTTKPDMVGGEHYHSRGEPMYETVCECFDEESAQLICDSLNAFVLQ